MSLEIYGWDEFFERSFLALDEPALEPARVVVAAGGAYRLARASGEIPGTLSGRFRHKVGASGGYPTVGDWVAVDPASGRIERLLPRRTRLSRKTAGRKTDEQLVAANIDVVFAVMGLDANFKPRRLERFLATVWESVFRSPRLET